MTIDLSTLKKAKNTVIGNPSAKLNLARDAVFIRTLVECLNYPHPDPQSSTHQVEIRIEAAHVVASLSYGSQEALAALLHAHAPRAFLYAISRSTPADPPALKAAFARGLRALAGSIADVVGPSLWGLRPEQSVIRDEARAALDYLFQNDSLDIYLPLLTSLPPSTTSATPPTTTAIQTAIAHLLATTIRTPAHRALVSAWLPPAARSKDTKSRGWEKPEAARAGGWVARCLGAMLPRAREGKLVEALLGALAALARDNPGVAGALAKPGPPGTEAPSVLSLVLSLSKSRAAEIQLAACLCATHVFRASAAAPHPSAFSPLSPAPLSPASSASSAHPPTHGHHPHAHAYPQAQAHADDPCVRTVLNIANRLLGGAVSLPAPDPHADRGNERVGLWVKTRACFVLYDLVSGDPALCQAAFEHGCLGALARVVWTVTLPEDAPGAVAAGVAGAGPSAGVDADMHESLILVSAY